MAAPADTYTMLVFEHEPHYEALLKLLGGPFVSQSPIPMRPAVMRFSLERYTAEPAELHRGTFYSPFATLRRSSPDAEISIKIKTLVATTNRFLHRFPLREHVESIVQEACGASKTEASPTEVSISGVVNWLERHFSRLQAEALGAPSSPGISSGLAVTRLLLFFAFDAFVGVRGVNVEDLLDAINPAAIRAVIERDPVLSDSSTHSVRSSYIWQLAQMIKCHDHVGAFAHVVEGSLMDTYTGEFREVFTPELIELARTLIGRYQFGAPLALDSELRQDLVEKLKGLAFVCPDGRLAQHSIDRLWLNECLTRLFSESAALGSGPRRGNRLTYSSTATLLDAVSVSSLIIYNPGGQAYGMLDEIASKCRYVSADPFGTSISCDETAADSQNIFLIRNAQYSTISHITEKLRTMYSDYNHGAPLYCRRGRAATGWDYTPPRLLIEFDPYFSSDSVAWFDSFVKSLEKQRPSVVFYCMVARHKPATQQPEGGLEPLAVGSAERLKMHESRFQLGRLFTLGDSDLREGFIGWLRSHCVTLEATPPDAAIHEGIGDWLVERRVRSANGEGAVGFEAEVFLSEAALLAHREHWIQALYIAANNSALSFGVVTEDPDKLIQRLLDVRSK